MAVVLQRFAYSLPNPELLLLFQTQDNEHFSNVFGVLYPCVLNLISAG